METDQGDTFGQTLSSDVTGGYSGDERVCGTRKGYRIRQSERGIDD